jgi:WD40 repeat protein
MYLSIYLSISCPNSGGKPRNVNPVRVYSGFCRRTNKHKSNQIINYSKGSQIGEPLCAHKGNVSAVAFSQHGTSLASASWDNTVQFWDPQTWLLIGVPVPCHKRWVTSLSFSSDGKTIATCGAENTIQFRGTVAFRHIKTER